MPHTMARYDEIGEVLAAFRTMKAELGSLVGALRDKARDVADLGGQLTASSQQVAAGATQTAANVSQISASADDVAERAREVARAAEEMAALAAAGQQQLMQVSAQIENINAASRTAVEGISRLTEVSHRITQIVEVIRQIADQTNLLSLNAAIEAARAGEHGRGFAVVAEEVRKLAEQSARSAGEINDLVATIRREIDATVSNIEGSSRQALAGSQVVAQAARDFRTLLDTVQRVSESIREVARAAGEISGGVQNIAAAVQEQSATTQEISASVQALSRMAEELNALAARFKTGVERGKGS